MKIEKNNGTIDICLVFGAEFVVRCLGEPSHPRL